MYPGLPRERLPRLVARGVARPRLEEVADGPLQPDRGERDVEVLALRGVDRGHLVRGRVGLGLGLGFGLGLGLGLGLRLGLGLGLALTLSLTLSLSRHTRRSHVCRRVPGPPNFGMSRQLPQVPQFSAKQPEHSPHRRRLVPPSPPLPWPALRTADHRWRHSSSWSMTTSHSLPSRPAMRMPSS